MSAARLLFTLLLGLSGAMPLAALEPIPLEGRMGIGSTNILCTTEPCPWRGVIDLDDPARDPLRPYWSGEHLPKAYGSPEDVARLQQAWDEMKCLEIEGVFGDDGAPFIEIDRIVGPC